MTNIFFSALLSLVYLIFISLVLGSGIADLIKNLTGENNTYEMIGFLITGVFCGSLSAFIISKYKNFNFKVSMILPTIFTIVFLYPHLLQPIYFGAHNLIDGGLSMFFLISITTLYIFLKNQ
tara:strand:- start:6 stop:371 length:366 start_codon:yes stop_codon:yes gene_type:complete